MSMPDPPGPAPTDTQDRLEDLEIIASGDAVKINDRISYVQGKLDNATSEVEKTNLQSRIDALKKALKATEKDPNSKTSDNYKWSWSGRVGTASTNGFSASVNGVSAGLTGLSLYGSIFSFGANVIGVTCNATKAANAGIVSVVKGTETDVGGTQTDLTGVKTETGGFKSISTGTEIDLNGTVLETSSMKSEN